MNKWMIVCAVLLGMSGSVARGAFDLGKMFEGIVSGNSTRRAAMERAAEEERERLTRDVHDFNTRKASLAPEAAAAEWLALFDRAYPATPTNSVYSYRLSTSFSGLVEAIPAPAAWPELERLVLERDSSSARDALTRMFIFRLTGKYDALASELEDLVDVIDSDSTREVYLELLPRISRFQNREAEGFAELLELLANETNPDQGWADDLVVPDLVSLVGPDAATKLIQSALLLPSLTIEVPSEGETLRLVKELAVADGATLASPQWELITSAKDTALFERMDERFPIPEKQERNTLFSSYVPPRVDYIRERAMSVYVLGLIQNGQGKKAVDYVLGLDPETLAELDQLNRLARDVSYARLDDLARFYEAVLEARPTAPVRVGLFKCALLSGDTEKAIAAVNKELAQVDMNAERSIGARVQLASIYLALDEVESARSIQEELFLVELDGLSDAAMEQLVDVGESAVGVGALLGDDAWVDQGVARTLSAGRALDARKERWSFGAYGWRSTLFKRLVEMKRYDEALALSLERVAEEEKKQGAPQNESGFSMSFSLNGNAALIELMILHNAMGEFEKTVAVLEESTLWDRADLADVARSGYGSEDEVLYEAAVALNAVGRGAEAYPLLEAHLYREPAHDPSYRLLLDMKGADAAPLLEKLVARDRFEERPLIWKAVLLREQGRLAEAEDVVRAALAVDPTDGEQRAGDRVRAYAVLAEILTERGDAKNAAFFEDVVKSVRVAELGDQMHEAGLVTRGLKEYEKAEGLFADAYCVQWRLAERLYSMGRVEEAKKHYEIAFERLPEQFGQVASFCFGCEGVFDSEHTRGIAERVLLDLEKTTPDRPQLHYLLGQLRLKQGKANAAYQHLEKAVELDPDYLDAWDMLNDLSPRVSIPPRERDAIQLKLLELDPLQRHASVAVEEVSDLSALWRAWEKSAAYRVEMPEKLFNLPAAADYLAARANSTRFHHTLPSAERDDDSPEKMIAEDVIVDAIGSLLEDVTRR